jgi:hypothetical protein
MTTFPISLQESAQVAPKSYLEHAQEELNPDLLAIQDRKSTLWKVAAVGNFVLFAVAMAGVSIITGFYLPIAIPLVAIGAIVLLEPAKKAYALFMSWSMTAAERAAQLRAIHEHYQALDNATPEQLQSILESKGIDHVTGIKVNDLKPLIARHLFWENQIENLNEAGAKKLKEAKKLSESDFAENRERIYTLQSEALEHEKQALESKVKNAFINAVLRRPDFVGTLEEMGTFSFLSGQERAIGMQSSPTQEAFFTFKNASMQPLHYSEVKRSSLTDLALRMIPVGV